eukprot:4436773-Ditylum_brightwellii.AAC.1
MSAQCTNYDDEEQNSRRRRQKHNKEKPHAITFFNFPTRRLLHYTCKILEHPYSNPVIIASADENGRMKWDLIKATGTDITTTKQTDSYYYLGGNGGGNGDDNNNDNNDIGNFYLSESANTYKDILSKSRTC